MAYEIFIAYAAPDERVARDLYTILSVRHRVFLDSEALTPGDRWPEVISDAHRESRMTVVLISEQSESAYYQREEIIQAIELARSEEARRVIPVYIDKIPADVPYGLKQIQGIVYSKAASIIDTAFKIEAALELCQPQKSLDVAERFDDSEPDSLAPNSTTRAVGDIERKAASISGLRRDSGRTIDPRVFSVLYIDIDDFTVINRRFGESVGEIIIEKICGWLEGFRFYRWGGDELIVLLPEVEEKDAFGFAEMLRGDIEGFSWGMVALGLYVTASFGVSERKRGEAIEDWLIRAICGAYNAKRLGKNRSSLGPWHLPRDISHNVYDYGSW